MEITQANLVVFSPTGTTRRVVAAIGSGLGAPVRRSDLTLPTADRPRQTIPADHVTVIGAPVYAGRIPVTAAARLRSIEGTGGPAVVVVVYGNRAYDDALLELRDLAVTQGFTPIAAGAFIGEHSYANAAMPIATGRPDRRDLALARELGQRVAQKVEALVQTTSTSPVDVPGNRPYRARGGPSEYAPTTQQALCTLCGRCAEVCPVGAITVGDVVETNTLACTLCCACTRACPTGARAMNDYHVLKTAVWLHTSFSDPKRPETYL